MHRTLNDIRTEGLAALRKRLGKAGMIRFLQQFDPGRDDYTQQRREWVDRTSLDDLRKTAQKRKRRARSEGS